MYPMDIKNDVLNFVPKQAVSEEKVWSHFSELRDIPQKHQS